MEVVKRFLRRHKTFLIIFFSIVIITHLAFMMGFTGYSLAGDNPAATLGLIYGMSLGIFVVVFIIYFFIRNLVEREDLSLIVPKKVMPMKKAMPRKAIRKK